MSAKVLQLVNSAFFGLRVHVSSPAQAASLLGQDVIRSLVLVGHVFSEERQQWRLFSSEELQQHSLRVGSCAQQIGKHFQMPPKDLDHVFIAGILHDIGMLVMATGMTEAYEKVLARLQEGEEHLIDVEREVIGAGHPEVGAYLLGLWGFPDPVIEAVAYHHEPSRCLKREVSPLAAVHIANSLECAHSPYRGGKSNRFRDEDYLEASGCHVDEPVLRAICERWLTPEGPDATD
jgi:putative nucleotidyltransferase with HDIG domain